jgi:NAD(P)-dependent dehydrogenase (short-subunit alcohol dehydrogenase family)
MSKRVILITGANKGIGFEMARQLGKAGNTVLLASRDESRGKAAAAALAKEGIEAHPIVLDVDSASSIAHAVAQVGERWGHVDSLINNAGVVLEAWGGKTSETPVDVWQKTLQTNVVAVAAVTQAFLPLVRKSEAGRIVNMSSILGSLTLHSDPSSPIYHFKTAAYDASKAALNAYTVHLAYELRDTPIKVNAAHPGWVKTDLGGADAPMAVEDGAKTGIALATLPADGPTGAYIHNGERLPW